MTFYKSHTHAAVDAFLKVLDAPRNKFGKLIPTAAQMNDLQILAVFYDVGGCEDVLEQAMKVLKAAVIMDDKER